MRKRPRGLNVISLLSADLVREDVSLVQKAELWRQIQCGFSLPPSRELPTYLQKCVPLGVLLNVEDPLEQGGSEDAEREEEAHGEAEEEGGGEAIGEDHDVVVGRDALPLEHGAGLLEDGGARGGGDGDEDGEEERHHEQGDVERLLEIEGGRGAGELQRGVCGDLVVHVFGHGSYRFGTFRLNMYYLYMQENIWARLRDSLPGMCAIHATYPTYFPAFLYFGVIKIQTRPNYFPV